MKEAGFKFLDIAKRDEYQMDDRKAKAKVKKRTVDLTRLGPLSVTMYIAMRKRRTESKLAHFRRI